LEPLQSHSRLKSLQAKSTTTFCSGPRLVHVQILRVRFETNISSYVLDSY